MLKIYIYIISILFIIFTFIILTCDDYNVVEPRFFTEEDTENIPICDNIKYNINAKIAQKISQYIVNKEWLEYRIVTRLEVFPIDLTNIPGSDSIDYNFDLWYSITNIDTSIKEFQMAYQPPFLVEIDTPNLTFPETFDTVNWVLTLYPYQKYDEWLPITIRDASNKNPIFFSKIFLVGCVDPPFNFPMELEFSHYIEDVPVILPMAYSLNLCWGDETKDSLQISFSIPKMSHVKLQSLKWNGDVVRKLIDDMKFAGHYYVIWDLTNDDGNKVEEGVYAIVFKTDTYQKIISFEIN